MQDEDREIRLKRLRMRSWRRGMKEMDLILGPFADDALAELPSAMLDQYEAVLAQNDQDLYAWITALSRGLAAGPADLQPLLTRIASAALTRFQQDKAKF